MGLPNLVLTSNCNSKCDFCFSDKTENNDITIDQTESLFKFINSFNRQDINIVGGEPTMNQDFLDIVKYFIDRIKMNY